MTATATEPLRPSETEFRTPEQEQAENGGDVAAAHDLALEDINPLNAHLFRENRWQDYFERLRNEDPVHFNELESSGRYWSVTKYEDIKTVSADWETFSSAQGITLGFPADREAPTLFPASSPSFITQDGPGHGEQRKTVQPSVAPRHLAKLEPIIRERTGQVLDGLPDGEAFDWVDTVSIELTTMMLATLFDFPFEDRRKLTRWSDIVFAIPEPGGIVETQEQKRDELMGCVEYFSVLWEQRKQQPGDDLVSMLVHGEATKHLSAANHLGNLLLLIVGGNDTTRNTMSGSVYALDKFPEQYDKLVADPRLVKKMAPEIIRWQTPLSYMRRTANRDCELAGKSIKKNDQLLLWYISANRDEDVFENAHALDIERPNAGRHLSFGWGPHFCMGSRLAELQLRVLWEEVLQRFDRIEVLDEPERTFSSFVKGYTHLPVKIKRK
ncbi:MAG TPA: cytochrome P450 [Myxococcales bacterium]|nr:cytochrome P450 [Myxococcales bacterium]HIK85938.1 cytochrome P450 [Myxococcales bacterium]